jgi:hypothetical protein
MELSVLPPRTAMNTQMKQIRILLLTDNRGAGPRILEMAGKLQNGRVVDLVGNASALQRQQEARTQDTQRSQNFNSVRESGSFGRGYPFHGPAGWRPEGNRFLTCQTAVHNMIDSRFDITPIFLIRRIQKKCQSRGADERHIIIVANCDNHAKGRVCARLRPWDEPARETSLCGSHCSFLLLP